MMKIILRRSDENLGHEAPNYLKSKSSIIIDLEQKEIKN